MGVTWGAIIVFTC